MGSIYNVRTSHSPKCFTDKIKSENQYHDVITELNLIEKKIKTPLAGIHPKIKTEITKLNACSE